MKNNLDILEEDIYNDLLKFASKERKIWWEKYLRNEAIFLGIQMSDIRKVMNNFYIDIFEINDKDLFIFIENMFSSKESEMKMFIILFLEKYLKQNQGEYFLIKLIGLFDKIFKNKYVYDWNICDWLALKVVSKIIYMNIDNLHNELKKWIQKDNIWQNRCFLISLIPIIKTNLLDSFNTLEYCEILIDKDNRFAKNAVGWFVNEIFKQDLGNNIFLEFLVKNKKKFSKEAWRKIMFLDKLDII